MEKTLNSKTIYKGKIIDVKLDDVLLPNGSVVKREVVVNCGGATILAVGEQGLIPVVKQYRYGAGDYLYELPAGKLNEGEDALTCAIRELEEETGYIASKENITHLATIVPTPAYVTEKIYIYLATDLKRGSVHLDDDEFVDLYQFTLDQLLTMIDNGEIQDSKTIIGVYRYARMLNK